MSQDFHATVGDADEDGICPVYVYQGEVEIAVHHVRCDMAHQWAAQEVECLREYGAAR